MDYSIYLVKSKGQTLQQIWNLPSKDPELYNKEFQKLGLGAGNR